MPHILIADDDEPIRVLLQDYFHDKGYRVTAVADGRSALETLDRQGPFDLILLDSMIPHATGPEVMRELGRRGIKTPIISITVHTNLLDRAFVRALNLKGLIAKPFDIDELDKCVEDVLASG